MRLQALKPLQGNHILVWRASTKKVYWSIISYFVNNKYINNNNNNNNNRIFIQDNPSVQSTVINGVLLTKKKIKRKYALG